MAQATVSLDGTSLGRVEEPSSVAELCALLREVDRGDQHAAIVGGGTRLSFGNLGGPFDLVISTRRLNRVLRYDPDDLTLAVEPGCTIAVLAEVLTQSGQMMALDAAQAERSTIGGAYATGMSSPRRLGGGSLKDWTIGIEVAGPSGIVAKAGGMVVKNVTGYDMMHVHYGALGAFGVVTRLNLKVFPLPGPPRAVVLHYANPQAAHVAAVAVLESQLQPSSVLVSNDGGWSLRLRCDAPPAVVDRLAGRMIDVASHAAAPASADISEDASVAIAPFTAITDMGSASGLVRLSIPASRQLAAVAALASGGCASICADVGSGLVYASSAPDQHWIELVRSLDQRPVFLALPTDLKRGVDVFGEMEPANSAIVRRMKQEFDPAGRLNRGRFALGL